MMNIARKRRKMRADATAYASLISAPASGSFIAPANASMIFRTTAALAGAVTLATITGTSVRTVIGNDLPQGYEIRIEQVEKDSNVEISVNVEAFIDSGLGKFEKVGAGQ